MKQVKEILFIPIDDLQEWPGNPRINDHAVPTIADSIARFGMNVPVLIDQDKKLIAGNTRWKALKLLREQQRIPADTLVPCVDGSHMTPAEQQAYNVADNKLASISYWDDERLKACIAEIEAAGIPAIELGFSASEVEIMTEGWGGNASRSEGTEETSEAAPVKITIECQADDEAELRDFLELKLKEVSFTGVVFR